MGLRYNFEGKRNKEGKEKGIVQEGRVAQKFISTYFRQRQFSINTPVQALPGLLLLLAFDCRTLGLMTSVAVMSFYNVPFLVIFISLAKFS